jgi:type II secretory pathway predicted ATPase ExeA
MSAGTLPEPVKIRLQSHFAFVRLPFRKSTGYDEMFDSRAQRELLHGLTMWAELKGMGLVTGPSGAGKVTHQRHPEDTARLDGDHRGFCCAARVDV